MRKPGQRNTLWEDTQHQGAWQRRSGPRVVTLVLVASICFTVITVGTIGAYVATQSPHRDNTTHLLSTNTTTQVSGVPTLTFTLSATDQPKIDPAFAHYYQQYAGATRLGAPLTPAYPTNAGWIQYFRFGALLLPSTQSSLPAATGAPAAGSSTTGTAGQPSSTSGVVRIPLLTALVAVGSKVPLGGDDSSLTYADLRQAADPSALVPNQISSTETPQTTPATSRTFIPEGSRSGVTVGHFIPEPIWSYINDKAVSPDGWETDLGQPLTEALPFTATYGGATHQLLVQAFWYGALLVDTGATATTNKPIVAWLDVGLAYLRTFGPPSISLRANQRMWALKDTPVVDTPDGKNAQLHIGPNFALQATGDAQWKDGELWYRVSWRTPKRSGQGWVPANTIASTAPTPGEPGVAAFDALSTDLTAYLKSHGSNVGVVVYDITRQQEYTYNPDGEFIMASSAKVPIMLTLLTILERQQRGPTPDELSLLTTMIENSNNDSAQALFDEIGGAGPLAAFMQSVRVPGMRPDPDAWGWSTISPRAMVRLLTLLHGGTILTAQDRALALGLMGNIEPDQQAGVGDTAPSGAQVAMKDGWVQGPDGLWATNSSGIVTVGSETYMIAVYSQHLATLDDGQSIVRHVCGAVAQLLT